VLYPPHPAASFRVLHFADVAAGEVVAKAIIDADLPPDRPHTFRARLGPLPAGANIDVSAPGDVVVRAVADAADSHTWDVAVPARKAAACRLTFTCRLPAGDLVLPRVGLTCGGREPARLQRWVAVAGPAAQPTTGLRPLELVAALPRLRAFAPAEAARLTRAAGSAWQVMSDEWAVRLQTSLE
jgi:hypothetical protein